MIENKNSYNYVTDPWKAYLSFHTREEFYAMPEMEIPRQLVTKVNAAKRSPCKFLKFSSLLSFILGKIPVQWKEF